MTELDPLPPTGQPSYCTEIGPDGEEIVVRVPRDVGVKFDYPPMFGPPPMSACPYEAQTSLHMSNFDHEIDEGFAEELQTKKVWGCHTAWNFFGQVWWDRTREQFAEEVWHSHLPQEVFYADSLRELMTAVNAEWGAA